MKTNNTNKVTVEGINGRDAAIRLATLLMVIPTGVVSFTSSPDAISLSNGARRADITVLDEGVRLITSTRTFKQRAEYDKDMDAARQLLRFFA